MIFQLKVILSFTSWVFVRIIISIFAICIFSEQTEEKGIQWPDSLSEYYVAQGILKFQCKTWEFRATSHSVKPLYYLYPINKHIWKYFDVFWLIGLELLNNFKFTLPTNKEAVLYVSRNISLFYSDRTLCYCDYSLSASHPRITNVNWGSGSYICYLIEIVTYLNSFS